MGLTLNQETSDRVREVVLPPRMGRNEACRCGSGSKYKRCCWDRDEALRRQLRGAALPEWIDGSHSKLHQFEKYVCNVFGLPDLLASFCRESQNNRIKAGVSRVFPCGFLVFSIFLLTSMCV